MVATPLALTAALVVVAVVSLVGCAAAGGPRPTASRAPASFRYVAIGDSYTIGTSVTEAERWPNQLVDALAADGVRLELVANLAVNGASSADVLARQLPSVAELRPDFASVLVGVNDVVRRVPAAHYAANLETILDTLLGTLPADRLLVVATPDYTRMPMGGAFGDPGQQSAAIGEVNAIAAAAASDRAIAFVDISAAANAVANEPRFVARDGLHPSGRQYAAWVDLIRPVVRRLLSAGSSGG